MSSALGRGSGGGGTDEASYREGPVLRRAYRKRLFASEPCVTAGDVELLHRSCCSWVVKVYGENMTVKDVKTWGVTVT